MEVVQNTLNTQAEIIEYKRLLVEEDKKVVKQMIDHVAKEDSEGRVINTLSERSEYNIFSRLNILTVELCSRERCRHL